MSKIDERTSVPLMWLLMGLAAVVTPTIIGSFWVSSVNFRLSRIEEKLGIPAYKSAEVKHDVDTKRLLDPIPDVQAHE